MSSTNPSKANIYMPGGTSTQLRKKSAWAKGPPQSPAPSPRSQSPAPNNASTQPTHSRRPSTLGQGVPIKDGVSVPRSNVGVVKQGSAVTFGSIDDVTAPISSSPASTPAIKSEGVKSFGTVPATAGHTKGKSSVSLSRPALTPSSASIPLVSTPATPFKINKMDIRKLFQSSSSTPPSIPSSGSSSHSVRPSTLPPQSSQHSQPPPPSQPKFGTHSYPSFVPSSGTRLPQQHSGPGGVPGSGPRSPIYSRQASIRSDSRPLGGSDGTGDPPQMSGMSNPHPGPHLHQEPPSGTPPQSVLVPECPIYYHPPPTQQGTQSQLIAPLERSQNAWVPASIFGTLVVDSDSPDLVDKKVKGLLNKLTIENFDSVSDQIIAWANKSEMETDGRTLAQVIRLVFEKAVNEALWLEMYARLCKKIMQQISPKVQDDGIKNNNGKPTAGGQLFRKYLLNRCQENFERVWVAKEDVEDQAAKAANKSKDGENEEEILLHSDEYYAAQKAKLQGLGLIKFIGELFKLQMLTERIMHECVKKLLGNIENPEEEEIESLCTLLTTVGLILDTPKARAHMDVYFSRMKELTKNVLVRLSRRLMLQGVIDLRTRKWVPHNLDRDGWTVSGVPCPPIKAGVTKAGR